MNISLTPIDEAWKISKPKKGKEKNKFTEQDTQKDILQKSSLPLNNNIPKGNDLLESNFQKVSNMEIANDENNKSSIEISITKPSILEKLAPFNSSYIQQLVHKGLELILNEETKESVPKKSAHVEKIEKFTNDEDLNMLIYILIGLIIIDILFKFK